MGEHSKSSTAELLTYYNHQDEDSNLVGCKVYTVNTSRMASTKEQETKLQINKTRQGSDDVCRSVVERSIATILVETSRD